MSDNIHVYINDEALILFYYFYNAFKHITRLLITSYFNIK